VFLIVLSEQAYNETFSAASSQRYFNKTLTDQGELLTNYYAVAGGPLANEIAMISGQGPTQQTVADCPLYSKLAPAGRGSRGQVIGQGCVYPSWTKTLPAQLVAAHRSWKAYVEGLGEDRGEAAPCAHPRIGAHDATAPATDRPYATWTNPFVYFGSLTAGSGCRHEDVGLAQLKLDLSSARTTPSFSYIAPSPCDDGASRPCAHDAPAGLGPAERFLSSTLAEIKASPAYRAGGLIAITFDEAPQTGPDADSSSCCGNPAYPNLPAASGSTTSETGAATTTTATTTADTTTTTADTTTTTADTTTTTADTTTTTADTTTTTTALPADGGLTSPTGGGGQVGLLLVSPWVKPATQDVLNYFNHFALLASIENLFGLGHLGYAADPALQTIPAGDFNGNGPS
jgi:hypothetical protein